MQELLAKISIALSMADTASSKMEREAYITLNCHDHTTTKSEVKVYLASRVSIPSTLL